MKKMNKKGFVLLETVIVAVFIIAIFTFVYMSVVPLLGRYDELSHSYEIEVSYKLYHIRDAIYKDDNFEDIVKENYNNILPDQFNDKEYYNSLLSSLVDVNDYQIFYVRKLDKRLDEAIGNLNITGAFKEYIKKTAKNKANSDFQNFIFLRDGKNFGYLGLAVDLDDLTNYRDPKYLYEEVEESLADNLLPDDGDARIISGDNTINNYVWYSGKLWRIVALNNNGTIKMITDENITTIFWGANTTYDGSWVYQWLNEDFKNTLYNYEKLLVTDYKWNATQTTSTSKPDKTTMVGGTVGLLNAYEYVKSYSKVSSTTGYLNNEYDWWLITQNGDSSVWFVDSGVGAADDVSLTFALGARPSINFQSNIMIASGYGSEKEPYIIEGDISIPNKNELLSNRVSGEYVNFDNELYRIVSIENNITKITKVDYIRDYNGNAIFKNFTKFYATYGTGTDVSYLDYYLNNDWYNAITNDYRSMIMASDWYLGKVACEPNNSSYKNSICATQNTTETIANCSKTNAVYTGYVGLGRIGEMFTSQIGDRVNEPEEMWTITPDSSYSVLIVSNNGTSNYGYPTYSSFSARPSLHLKSSVQIILGTGTEEDPFEISL